MFNCISLHHHHYHSVFCLTTGSKPPPKRFLHIVRTRASSFKWEYPLLSVRLSSSFLRLLLRLLVTTIPLFIFLMITFITYIKYKILNTVSNNSRQWWVQIIEYVIICRMNSFLKNERVLFYFFEKWGPY